MFLEGFRRKKTEAKTPLNEDQAGHGDVPDYQAGLIGEIPTGLLPGSRVNLQEYGNEILVKKPEVSAGAKKKEQDIGIMHTNRGAVLLMGTGIAAAILAAGGKVLYDHLKESKNENTQLTQKPSRPFLDSLKDGYAHSLKKVVSFIKQIR